MPIVAILGHVDHGKTTILDYIRKTHVQAGEVGGMTQKISAFTVDVNNKKITFIDTPGHEAFDLMRLRGGSIADIVLLIVAADDSVKPQTEESIEIIKNSKAKPILVINKVDLPDINIEKVKRDVNNKGILLEGLGGQVPVVQVSGKTGKGIDTLLETISLLSDVEGLIDRGALPENILGKGYVLESIKDKSMGNVATVVITQGRLEKGNLIGFKSQEEVFIEKTKGIITEEGNPLDSLDTGYGAKILGLSKMIELGSEIFVLEKKDEKLLEGLFTKKDLTPQDIIPDNPVEEEQVDLAAFFGEAKDVEKKTLKVIIKASSEGSLEAIKKSLSKIEVDEYTVEIVSSGVGSINLKDADMAKVSKAIILGFEVSMEAGLEDYASKNKILVRSYDIIYKLVEEIHDVIESMSLPAETEEEIGSGEVKQIFVLSNGSQVIGCRVLKGVLKKGGKVYIVRGDDIITEGRIESLKHLKDTINEATVGMDCGVVLDTKADTAIGDSLYCYKVIR